MNNFICKAEWKRLAYLPKIVESDFLPLLIVSSVCLIVTHDVTLALSVCDQCAHFLRETVDLPMREAAIWDLLAIMLLPLAVPGLV